MATEEGIISQHDSDAIEKPRASDEQKLHFDIVVVGGGMVGSMFAAGLAHTSLSVAVLEQVSCEPFASSSLHDLRVSALSLASERMLDAVGAWKGVESRRACSFTHMKVWDGEASSAGETTFYAGDIGQTRLGHIVENRVLQLSLREQLIKAENIELLCPATLHSLVSTTTGMKLTLADQSNLTCKLVVGADGANSVVRSQAGIEVVKTAYPQHALVATVKTVLPQQSITWQRFLPSGPQAFLPLSDTVHGSQGSLVWYHDQSTIAELMESDEEEFLKRLHTDFPSELGRIERVYERGSFPLSCSHASRYVQNGVALIGDAAHTVHPLAGQGVNLGLLDAAVLAEVVTGAANSSHDVGALHNLRRYERWRRSENALMIQVLDGFYHAFKPQPSVVQKVRSGALSLVDRASPIRKLVTRYASGDLGDLPMLARGHLPG